MASADVQLMAHLMRRAGFGAPHEKLDELVDQGYEATVESLLGAVNNPTRLTDNLIRRYHPEYSGMMGNLSAGAVRRPDVAFAGHHPLPAGIRVGLDVEIHAQKGIALSPIGTQEQHPFVTGDEVRNVWTGHCSDSRCIQKSFINNRPNRLRFGLFFDLYYCTKLSGGRSPTLLEINGPAVRARLDLRSQGERFREQVNHRFR